MLINIQLGLEDLSSLPLELRQKIHQALNLPVTQTFGNQPVTQVPVPQPMVPTGTAEAVTQSLQPQYVVSTPVLPTKQPTIVGNTKVFAPTMGHISQQNAAVDVTTGRPVPLGNNNAPVIPQVSNAPAAVTPVTTVGPVATGPVPGADAATARNAAIRVYNRTDVDGKTIVGQALARAGLTAITQLNDQSAPVVYQALREMGGV